MIQLSSTLKTFISIFLIALFFFIQPTHASQNKKNEEKVIDTIFVTNLYDSAVLLINSNPDDARLLMKKVLVFSNDLQFHSGQAKGYNFLGVLAYQRGLHDSSAYYFNKSLVAWELLNNQKQVSNLLGNISVIYAQQNKLPDAISYNRRSIQLKLQFGDTVAIANGFNNLSLLYNDIGNTKEAINLQYKSILLRKAVNDSIGLASNYGNLGDYYNAAGELDSAEYFIQKSLALHLRQVNKWGLSNIYGVLSEWHYLNQSLDSAEFYVGKSLDLSNELGLADLTEEMLILQSRIFLDQDRPKEALQIILKKEKFINDNLSISALEILAQIYLKKEEYKKASFYFEKYTSKNDSLQVSDLKNNISELTANYSYELKEVDLINKQNIKEAEFARIIANEQLESTRLWLFALSIASLLVVSIWFLLLIKRKNTILNNQRKEIDKLIIQQKEIIDMRTSELLSTKSVISRYAFLNSHELRGPLARILGMIHLSDKENVDQETFIKLLKLSAKEMDEAVKKISSELNQQYFEGKKELPIN